MQSERTELIGGADEPLYLPGQPGVSARLFYRENFAASALHESAHWCIAGEQRRRQIDFGYAYQPPPRTDRAQAQFFTSEVRAQALECRFAQAAGADFKPSADNLAADVDEFTDLLETAREDMEHWLNTAPGRRARLFIQALLRLRCDNHGSS